MPESQVDQHDLLKLVLDSYEEEHKSLIYIWKNLETKAQGTGALGGVFLAACFAWTRDLPGTLVPQQKTALCISLVLLVCSILAALVALVVRTLVATPRGSRTKELVPHVLLAEKMPLDPQRLDGLMNDLSSLWNVTNADLAMKSRTKATWVLVSQTTLLLAALCLAAMSATIILS